MAIDFTSILKGQRAAESDYWTRLRNQQAQEQYAIQHEEQLAKLQQNRIAREAASYLSSVTPNLNRAADSSVDPVVALIDQRTAIMNDPYFRQAPPELQQQILDGYGNTVSLRIQKLIEAGKEEDAQRLAGAFGLNTGARPLDTAIRQGNPQAIVQAAGYTVDADGMVQVGNVKVPLADAAYSIAAANAPAGALQAAANVSNQQRTLDAAAEQRRQQGLAQVLQGQAQGLTPQQLQALGSIYGLTPADMALVNGQATMANGTMPGAIAGPTTSTEAIRTPGAATPAAAPGAATPAAVTGAAPTPVGSLSDELVPSEVWQRLADQVQQANSMQLSSSARTLSQVIAKAQQEQEALSQVRETTAQQLNDLRTAQPSPFSPNYETWASRVQALDSYIKQIDAKFKNQQLNMEGLARLARMMDAKARTPSLPTVGSSLTSDLSGIFSQ